MFFLIRLVLISVSDGRDYFSGAVHVARVRAWRAAHPGHSLGRARPSRALQDSLAPQVPDAIEECAIRAQAPEAPAAVALQAFKRLKHRLHLESVSGLSQHAVLVDVAAKVLADNIASLLSAEADSSRAEEDVSKPDRPRKSNRALAAHTIARALPAILLRVGSVIDLINDVIDKLASDSRRTKPGRSNPRPTRPYKPHPALSQKG